MTKISFLLERLAALLSEHESKAAQAFLKAIQDLRDHVSFKQVVEALERYDIEGAIAAMNLDPAVYRVLDQAINAAYVAAGDLEVDNMPKVYNGQGAQIIVRFTDRNARAEMQLRTQAATRTTRIVDEQLDALRRSLADGLAAGRGPRQTALDVVGRINPATGRREGGIIGLTAPQAEWVESARKELLEGSTNYFDRKRRDKRFDATIRQAMAEGRPLSRSYVEKAIGRYSDRLLQLRGETLARSETLEALNGAQVEAWEQMLDNAGPGALQIDEIEKVWRDTDDNRTRLSHKYLDGRAVGLREEFKPGLRYPGDPNAETREKVSCRCRMFIRLRKKKP